MVINKVSFQKSWDNIRAYIDSDTLIKRYSSEQPLRSELFNTEQLERHARSLAEWQEIDTRPGKDMLLARLSESEEILLQVYAMLTEAVASNLRIAPASEWQLDNFYKVEEQIRLARKHLPKDYSRQLPHLTKGPLAEYPRVYNLVRELIIHMDGRLDIVSLDRYVKAYQEIKILNLGELWAIPIMLRLALIENIRRISLGIASDRSDRNLADFWADRIILAAETNPNEIIVVVADMARSDPPMSSAFVAELARRLQGQSRSLTFPLTWLEQRLLEMGSTIDQMVQMDIKAEAADRTSIGNSIGSFQVLDSIDWREFVEAQSAVEAALLLDPAGVYPFMDFASRDRYRHIVESLAKRSHSSEEEVALKAVNLAQGWSESLGINDRTAHVGYFLIDKGLSELDKAIQIRRTLPDSLSKICLNSSLACYLGLIALITAAITAIILAAANRLGVQGWYLVLASFLLFLFVSSSAVGLVNWLTTLLLRPRALPRIDYSKGIPDKLRTLVVIPSVLKCQESISELSTALELCYLTNRDKNVYFGLLTDFKDGPEEVMPEDEDLLKQARIEVEELNRKYPHEPFFLFHRPRKWNPQDRIWMGYERKRGILEDLNALLLAGTDESFSLIGGDVSILPGVRYVITLDEDSRMPQGSAHQLVGILAHPLNRPRYNEDRQCVVEGYSILQPRLSIGLPQANKSRFSRLFAGEPGIDPYTREVSDVYQDLFGEGSFAGKGIYDVEAFAKSLSGRFPENRILSHDLLEGCYARAALVSDVQFYEEFPYRYTADMNRRHRWIRGDWQIASWLLRRVPGPGGIILDNPISGVSKWKILDNLRRSIVPISQILMLILGWSLEPVPWFWIIVVAGIVMMPPTLSFLTDILKKPAELSWKLHLHSSTRLAARNLAQAALSLIFLPYEAYLSLYAIGATLTRMLITRRHLLEWNSASDALRNGGDELADFYRSMWAAPAISTATAIYLIIFRLDTIYAAGPLLALWFLSPALAWWVSQPLSPYRTELTADQRLFLRKLSRRTWRFFETFVGPDNNWLPPDNYQEYPRSVIANGTSPTNMGLSLLSNLAAYDFGYISPGRLIDRTERSMEVMKSLEKFQGHLFNWYDTKLLIPLEPRYISTVDSGNLAGHLLTLRQGLLEIIDSKILTKQAFEGFRDTIDILKEAASGRVNRENSDEVMQQEKETLLKGRIDQMPSDFLAMLQKFDKELESPPNTLSSAWMLLDQQARAASGMIDRLGPEAGSELKWWMEAYERQLRDHLEDLVNMAPWLMLPLWAMVHPPLDQMPSLGSAKEVEELSTELLALDDIPALREVPGIAWRLGPLIDKILKRLQESGSQGGEVDWFIQLKRLVTEASDRASLRIASIEKVMADCTELSELKFEFLFNQSRNFLAIGYNAGELRRDASCYDLLASEARLASFIAVAGRQLKQDHWFSLGRMLTSAGGDLALLSWGGTMFEYLMPLLIMPSYENTLLDQTYRAVVKRQIEYGEQRGVPWGITESGYNMTDSNLIYQYRAFGVPGLGFKRGLIEDLVVAPYASALALMVDPKEACWNMQRMAAQGYLGEYGLYEAIDFTPSRLSRDQSSAVVRSFMVHHQGMTFLSLAYLLKDQPMQRRFMSNPIFKASELLLQEKVPKAAPFYPHAAEVYGSIWRAGMLEPPEFLRTIDNPNSPFPEVHLLSNGRYMVMVTSAGSGYSSWKDLAVTRWLCDPTGDGDGFFFYVRDLDNGEIWSAGYQPTLKEADKYQAVFQKSLAEFWRRDQDIVTYTEMVVSPEDDIELRTINLTNRSSRPRRIELTSYAEVVLDNQLTDLSHPAFSNLFVQTEIIEPRQAILCARRPKANEEKNPWMVHLITTEGVDAERISYETDRYRFLGRARTAADPISMEKPGDLSNSQGAVLDPIVAIRCSLTIDPGRMVRVNFITGIAETRDAALGMVEKYHDPLMADRVYNLSWTHGQVILQQLNITESELQVYERLAGAVIYPRLTWRAGKNILASNRSGQSALWAYGISGDYPIVLLKIGDRSNLELVRQLLKAHAYWRMMGLKVDMLILNEDSSGYKQLLQDEIMGILSSSTEAGTLDRPGGVFVRKWDQISEEARVLMQTSARAIITDTWGTLEDQLAGRMEREPAIPMLRPTLCPRPTVQEKPGGIPLFGQDLTFFNGLGGFTQDGREYIIRVEPGQVVPAPWSNVIAGPRFGTLITDSGGGYTWMENSQQFRLTTWYNDPVSDISGEAVYIRDEESGEFWSPTSMPARGAKPYTARHGFGYSVFEHLEDGIRSELWIYVALDATVKFAVLKLKNESDRPRKLSATYYAELVLGDLRSKNTMYIVTEIDPRSGALFAHNPYNTDFSNLTAFLDCSEPLKSFTGDRTEFLGRNGTASCPSAMRRVRLSGRTGPALDPCASVQVPVDLAEGQEKELVFILGAGCSVDEARGLAQRFKSSGEARKALEAVWRYWNSTLGAIYLETPDKSLNILANGWLVYQALSSRFFARTGYYQSSGAFGFRDQLQDVLALLYAQPGLAREHLLRCASHQFLEGDVHHWWHPPSGRGVRTHISDDYLWLPFAVHRYVQVTRDTGVLDEKVSFIEGRPLKPDEENYYDLPIISKESGTLYEHCVRAIKYGLKYGCHGLPLMGTGDWNDGMNRVGFKGKGESVWLAFFLYQTLTSFSEIALKREDSAFMEICVMEAAALKTKIQENGWDGDDGQWYLRAYFDDGRTLGSKKDPECQIDSLSQSWSVLSGAIEPERSKTAMDAVDKRLVNRDSRIVQLLDPPFDKSDLDPGYIKGYLPGVRENGGQYAHASVWVAMAFAALGDRKRAWELLSMINPISHGSTPEQIDIYKVEPYVIAGDVYSNPQHPGRGGWTWYTGAAGWMYRLIIESILGLRLEADNLRFEPCLPPEWKKFKAHYKYRETFYHISFTSNGSDPEVKEIKVDGILQVDKTVHLQDDRKEHLVEVGLE